MSCRASKLKPNHSAQRIKRAMDAGPSENTSERPPLYRDQTFPRMDDTTVSPFARTKAQSAQSVPTPEAVDSGSLPLTVGEEDEVTERDLFERRGSSDSGSADEGLEGEELSALSRNIHEQPIELPIELMSSTDR